MKKYDIYDDIATRTGGDIYIGVVGPVRTGKSTFISKFMDNFVIPNINNKLQKQIATDEMPQSAAGKAIMTMQPKFIPANAVKVQFKNKTSAFVRLIDCVGYLIEGATGHMDEEKPRLVKTPWDEKEITFEKAAEIGTKKVIQEYSTIGIMVTTDGTFGEIERSKYVFAEEKVVKELKDLKKPFVIVLNSAQPNEHKTAELAEKLEKKYSTPVIVKDVSKLDSDDINGIIEKVLLEFPICSLDVALPKWMQALPKENSVISEILFKLKESSCDMVKMCDFNMISSAFDQNDNIQPLELCEIKMGEGVAEYKITPKQGLFYKMLSEECGENVADDYELMNYIKDFACSKKKFSKIKDALKSAEENGYGVVFPTIDEMNLDEPALVKQGGGYGVKLKASAPSLHIMKVDVSTEVSPIVGTEKQGEDLINFIMNKFEDNPSAIWETNMFGKSLYDLVNEGLVRKLDCMPNDAQFKLRKTLTRIVNENKGGVICILL